MSFIRTGFCLESGLSPLFSNDLAEIVPPKKQKNIISGFPLMGMKHVSQEDS